jgi:hypothetical protein
VPKQILKLYKIGEKTSISCLDVEIYIEYNTLSQKNPQKYVSKVGLGNHELSHFFSQKVAIFWRIGYCTVATCAFCVI